jgi:hypothetical protein
MFQVRLAIVLELHSNLLGNSNRLGGLMNRFIAVAILCCLCPPAYPQDSLNVNLTGSLYNTWNSALDVAVAGNYAYVASHETGLRVLDISDLTTPAEVGYCSGDYQAAALEVIDGYAYLAGNLGGLRIIDISDPFNPVDLVVNELPFNASDVSVFGNYACVESALNRLWIVDISDPSEPDVLDDFLCPDLVEGVAMTADYVYIADYTGGVRVLDYSEPTELTEVGYCDFDGIVRSISVAGEHIYVANHTYGMRVISISDPTSPEIVGLFDTPGSVERVEIVGNLAYISDNYEGLYVVDISDPTAPIELGFNDSDRYPTSCAIAGDNAFVVGHNDLTVLDVGDPADILDVGAYQTVGSFEQATFSNGYAFVAAADAGLRIIDVNDPYAPFEVGVFEAEDDIACVDVVGDYAYVCVDDSLYILDIQDPSSPTLTGFCASVSIPYCITVVNGYAYCGGLIGMSVIDVRDPTTPVEISEYETQVLEVRDVAVRGDYAFLANTLGGVRVVDISDPTEPSEVGSSFTVGWAYGVEIEHDYLYVASGNVGLAIVDISDPADPDHIRSLDMPGFANAITVENGYAFLTDRQYLHVVDMRDPFTPVETGYYETPWDAVGVATNRGYAYVADTYSFRVMDCTAAAPQPPVEITLTAPYPLVVTQGGSFEYDVSIESFLPALYNVDIWTHVELQFGDLYGPIWRINSFPMTPNTIINATDINQLVPANAPVGQHTFFLSVGQFPTYVAAQSWCTVNVIPDREIDATGLTSWAASGFEQAFGSRETMDRPSPVSPQKFRIAQAWPNPFNPSTTLSVNLPEVAELNVSVFNVTGQQVAVLANGQFNAGSHTLTFDAANLASGLYFIRAIVPGHLDQTQKVMLAR